MKKIGLFYSPPGGSTERVAKMVAEALGKNNVDLLIIDDKTTLQKIEEYNNLIFGISTVGKDTWDTNYTKSGWDSIVDNLGQVNFSAKKVALFGLGNQIIYPTNFVDSLGTLGQKLLELKAQIVGKCPTDGYDYQESKAEIDGAFIGLPIDEDTQDELTLQRVNEWAERIKKEFE